MGFEPLPSGVTWFYNPIVPKKHRESVFYQYVGLFKVRTQMLISYPPPLTMMIFFGTFNEEHFDTRTCLKITRGEASSVSLAFAPLKLVHFLVENHAGRFHDHRVFPWWDIHPFTAMEFHHPRPTECGERVFSFGIDNLWWQYNPALAVGDTQRQGVNVIRKGVEE